MPTSNKNTRTGKISYQPDPHSFFVAGFPYSDGKSGFDRKGLVTLLAEPENKYDKEALAVYIGDTKVGYVPRPLNSFLTLFMKNYDMDNARFYLSDVDLTRTHNEVQITLDELSI